MRTPTPPARSAGGRLLTRIIGLLAGLALVGAGFLPAANAATYTRISGNGSSWAGNAVNQWVTDVKSQGSTVDYKPDGSSSGRKDFATGLSDFAVSEIPYKGDTADPQDTNFPNFSYSMLPVVAGGTSFMYNLPVGGKRFENLKLSQEAVALIFSGQVTQWNDPAIARTNPGVALPAQRITVVVRSDGSGATAQFTLWMKRQFPQHYAKLCAATGGCPGGSGATSYYPYQNLSNFTAQSGSNGVTTYTTNTQYTINYDEYSYALGVGFPVAKVGNAAGFYTVPTDSAVAVALTKADINKDPGSPNYLAQDLSNVYAYGDPRTYPLSAYSYMLAPSQTRGNFDNAKGAALGNFATYSLCEGQQTMGRLGYSPLPMNLVLAAMDQVRKIPGLDGATTSRLDATTSAAAGGSGNPCNNPTFRPGDTLDTNQLVRNAPFPEGCDAACQAPWKGADAARNAGPGGGAGAGAGGGAGGAQDAAAHDAAAQDAAAQDAAAQDAAADPLAGTVGDVVCDADTGECTDSAGNVLTGDAANSARKQAGISTVGGGAKAVSAVPMVLDGPTGWGTPQNLMLIAGLLMLGLIIGPPLVARVLSLRKAGRP